MKKYSSILLLFLFFSCKKNTPNITPAFYHWQTEFQLEPSEKAYLQNFPIKKMYVKFFDVDWHPSGEPLPQAEVIWNEELSNDIEIIPTVFITNRSLKNYPLEKMEDLGDKILEKIVELFPTEKENISEIQIDCDWSGTTKEKYFRLLSFLRKNISQEKIKLSATIRLHQIKFYQQTGVPPVDKGMLMFYNVGEVTNISTKNSILDLEIAKQYLGNVGKYPLQLDLALPIFSWGVLFRDGKMIKLISGLSEEDLRDTTRFETFPPTPLGRLGGDASAEQSSIRTVEEKSKSRNSPKNQIEEGSPLGGLEGSSTERIFHIKKSTYLDGRYLYEGDEIRLESVNFEMLEETVYLLKKDLPNDDLTISFYHLNTTTIKQFPYEKLQNICHLFY